MLVVGRRDLDRLRGHQKSSKHRKAEKLIADGLDIQILSEADFCELARIEMPPPKPPRQQASQEKLPVDETSSEDEFGIRIVHRRRGAGIERTGGLPPEFERILERFEDSTEVERRTQ